MITYRQLVIYFDYLGKIPIQFLRVSYSTSFFLGFNPQDSWVSCTQKQKQTTNLTQFR